MSDEFNRGVDAATSIVRQFADENPERPDDIGLAEWDEIINEMQGMKKLSTSDVCVEASTLINGDRRKDYEHPSANFKRIADLWATVLGREITPRQVGLCMILMKVAREIGKHKRDNLTDICGYAGCIEMLGSA